MVGACGISTGALVAAPIQSVTNSFFSSIVPKLILIGVLIGIAVFAIALYRRSNKKELKEEKQNFRPKGGEKK